MTYVCNVGQILIQSCFQNQSIRGTVLYIEWVSDLVENIVDVVDVHHLENGRWKSSSVNRPSASMFLTHSIPITFFLCPCERLFWPRFWALGWWNVLGICFRFGWPRTAVPERANRSDKNIVSLFPSLYCWSFDYCWSESVWGLSDNFEFLTKFKAKLAFGVFVIVDAPFLRLNSRS
jgi:hypothetical protein